MDKKKNYKVIALSSFVICILAWIPNIVFQIPSPFWMSTFVVAPVGIVFATLIRKSWLIVANTLMFFSFFILMFVGYVVNANFY